MAIFQRLGGELEAFLNRGSGSSEGNKNKIIPPVSPPSPSSDKKVEELEAGEESAMRASDVWQGIVADLGKAGLEKEDIVSGRIKLEQQLKYHPVLGEVISQAKIVGGEGTIIEQYYNLLLYETKKRGNGVLTEELKKEIETKMEEVLQNLKELKKQIMK